MVGETISTLEKVSDEWMRGQIGTREGIFPVVFVKILSEIPTASQIQQKPKDDDSNSSGIRIIIIKHN